MLIIGSLVGWILGIIFCAIVFSVHNKMVKKYLSVFTDQQTKEIIKTINSNIRFNKKNKSHLNRRMTDLEKEV